MAARRASRPARPDHEPVEGGETSAELGEDWGSALTGLVSPPPICRRCPALPDGIAAGRASDWPAPARTPPYEAPRGIRPRSPATALRPASAAPAPRTGPRARN